MIPAQGEFGSDIPAGDGKLANIFLRCILAGIVYKIFGRMCDEQNCSWYLAGSILNRIVYDIWMAVWWTEWCMMFGWLYARALLVTGIMAGCMVKSIFMIFGWLYAKNNCIWYLADCLLKSIMYDTWRAVWWTKLFMIFGWLYAEVYCVWCLAGCLLLKNIVYDIGLPVWWTPLCLIFVRLWYLASCLCQSIVDMLMAVYWRIFFSWYFAGCILKKYCIYFGCMLKYCAWYSGCMLEYCVWYLAVC